MPKIIGHTPPWLSQPSPGARIFSDPEAQSPASPSKRSTGSKSDSTEPATSISKRKLVAHRGSEIFTVVGNKIRWADLSRVKDEWETQSHRQQPQGESAVPTVYRTFKTPVYYQITNISISPSGHFIAISTAHSVHVAILPPSTRLHDADPSEIRLKTFQIGPTTHVIPEAPLAGVLWHPLAAASASTDCLVTVTTDAAVRVWEIERTNHWSFERPALAIDLRKLADGTSSEQNFEPSGFGRTRAFSADNFDMEAAAICFGGVGADNEDPWASMTLWTSMTNGDVYALCPLLPSKWTPFSTTVAALTTSAVARLSSISPNASSDEQKAARQRYEWAQELDADVLEIGDNADGPTRLRPTEPGAIPRLQGPFYLPIELDDDVEVSDVLVIPANLDEEDVFSGEDDYEIVGGAKSLPFSIVCLATTDNKVHVMIELEGVMGQWLPNKGKSSFSVPTSADGEFVLLESVLLPNTTADKTYQPTFTTDPTNSYQFFATSNRNVVSLSMEDWAFRVGKEASDVAVDAVGLDRRLATACEGAVCVVQDLVNQRATPLSTSALIDDIHIGTLLLTTCDSRAIVVQLDQSSFRTSKLLSNNPHFSSSARSQAHTRTQSTFRASQSLMQVLQPDCRPSPEPLPTREAYVPPRVFYENHMLPIEQLRRNLSPRHQPSLTQKPMQMSPTALTIMADTHRSLSNQTAHIERAVAELFRRCERLRQELADQVGQMGRLAERLHQIGSGNENEAPANGHRTHDKKLDERIVAAQKRQKELIARYERARKRAAQLKSGNGELSAAEKGWISEVETLSRHVGIDIDDADKEDINRLSHRLDAARELCEEMKAEARRIKEIGEQDDGPGGGDGGRTRSLLGGPGRLSRFQRERVKEVMEMVEREEAIIEAVRGRLAGLGVQA